MSANVKRIHADDQTTCEVDWDFTWENVPECEHDRRVELHADKVDDDPMFLVIGQGLWQTGADLKRVYRDWTARGGDRKRGHSVATFDAETALVAVGPMGVRFVGNPPTWEDVN